MQFFFSQFYNEPGIYFNISFKVIKLINTTIADKIEMSEVFKRKYGSDYCLNIRLSARTKIDNIEIKGPTIFKKDKDVDYFINLPYDVIAKNKNILANFIKYAGEGLCNILEKYNFSLSGIRELFREIIKIVTNNPEFAYQDEDD